jgi:hypothetical protein
MLSNFVQFRDLQAALGEIYSLQITPSKIPSVSIDLLIKPVISLLESDLLCPGQVLFSIDKEDLRSLDKQRLCSQQMFAGERKL